MPQIIVQPAGNQGGREHYRDTVAAPVPLVRVLPYLPEDLGSQLQELFPGGAVPTWGVTPGANGANEKKWQRIEEGDVALFLRESRAYAAGTVSIKTRSPELARELWGTDPAGQTWEYVYFLRDVHQVDIPYSELNRLLGYKEANPFQGFNVVAADRSANLLVRLGEIPEPEATRYWWVNQGTSYRQERDGGYVWAPKTNKVGTPLAYHTNVARLRLGDVVLHYADGIRAVGRVTESGTEAERPNELPANRWESAGYLGRVTYRELQTRIPLNNIPHSWRAKEASEVSNGPFTRDASVKLGYLFPLTATFVQRLRSRFAGLEEDGVIEIEQDLSSLPTRAAKDFERAGLRFEAEAIARFAAALLTKPFVILTGLSGSGKTKLAQGFAHWLGCGSSTGRCSVVAVGPDWTSKESALGYPNALDAAAYSRTKALDLILRATSDDGHPHFLVLDEMNLSHVERYFADILSSMESGEPVDLHSGPEDRQGVPSALRLPTNLHIVGTVNVDETTYMFSPKVLDRANVLEFRADRRQLEALIPEAQRPNLALLDGLGSQFASRFASPATGDRLPESLARRLASELLLFFDVLAAEGYEFGYRTIVEVSEFVRMHRRLSGADWELADSFDAQVVQKLLPRIHGSQRQIEGTLRALAVICFEGRVWTEDDQRLSNAASLREQAAEAAKLTNRDLDPLTSPRFDSSVAFLPRSFTKVRRMLRQLDRNGFTSFAEA